MSSNRKRWSSVDINSCTWCNSWLLKKNSPVESSQDLFLSDFCWFDWLILMGLTFIFFCLFLGCSLPFHRAFMGEFYGNIFVPFGDNSQRGPHAQMSKMQAGLLWSSRKSPAVGQTCAGTHHHVWSQAAAVQAGSPMGKRGPTPHRERHNVYSPVYRNVTGQRRCQGRGRAMWKPGLFL